MKPFRTRWPYGFLALLVMAFFAKLLFTDRILARGDTFLYFYPYWHLAQESLLNGQLPVWNPHIFMGAPLLANSQVGFYYPLNWPLWYLLPVPYAVSASIVLHLIIAAWGMYLLGRRVMHLSPTAAVLASAAVACGGYLTAQVEHVNQLQGLAWLPWLLWVAGRGWGAGKRVSGISFMGLLFALQILAGHTQTVFISGIGLGLWQIGRWQIDRSSWIKSGRGMWRLLWPVAAGGSVALFLAAAQILPTLELIGLSSRSGGLTANEIVSFSWHPLLIPRALLPAIGQSLFTEYVAFLPLTVWVLAVTAVLRGWRAPQLRPLLLLTIIGFWLALGRFGGLYWLLSELPGFNLFRVPARWLILPMIGSSLLAGWGLDQILADRPTKIERWLPVVLVGGLIVAQFPAVWLARFVPLGPEAPAEWPALVTLAWQGGELLLVTLWVYGRLPLNNRLLPLGVSLISLFLASRALPYNNPTTPEAYFDRRPPSLRLTVEGGDDLAPGRYLSLSNIFFDPGDQAEIDTIYAGSLPPEALYDYTIAIKLKEVIAPNLSAVVGLYALDGFDGGILPLNSYSELMARTVLQGESTTDGRLREFLPAVPDRQWLSLFGVRHLITDKVGDEWIDGVYFDRQLPKTIEANQTEQIEFIPEMQITSLWLLSNDQPGIVLVETFAGDVLSLVPQQLENGVWAAGLPNEGKIRSAAFMALDGPWKIDAVSLVHEEEGTFYPAAVGPFRLIHSGDVKIYEFYEALPRAVAVRPGSDAILADLLPNIQPEFITYDMNQIEISVRADDPVRLVLLEANYPGWKVEIDGQPAEIVTVDGFFRGVDLPAGDQKVTFSFRSQPVRTGLVVSLLSFLIWIGAVVYTVGKKEVKKD